MGRWPGCGRWTTPGSTTTGSRRSARTCWNVPERSTRPGRSTARPPGRRSACPNGHTWRHGWPGWRKPLGMAEWKEVLDEATHYAIGYLDGLPSRPVGSNVTLESLRETLDHPLPSAGVDARDVIAGLARDADPGVVASSSGRF